MKNDNGNQEQYYQAIARRLFQLRGAPFVISPRENETIKSWERMRIPLRIILEGIESAFEFCSPGMKKKLSLNSCHLSVLRRFKQHRDRRVGNRRPNASVTTDTDKKVLIQKEIRIFLSKMPVEASFLAPVFNKVSRRVLPGGGEEAELEKWDQKIDDLIFENIPPAEKEKIRKEMEKEYGLFKSRDLERMVRIFGIKKFREKNQVPYLSPYYY